ncbi:MAG: M1 family aminopeptidase [Bacteroidota bacterium]
MKKLLERNRFTLALLLLWCGSVYTQPESFDKAGRFIAPDQGLSLGRVHHNISSYDGPQPFDMLSYALDLYLPMTSDAISGTCVMTMRLKQSVDSLVLNAVGLQLDSVLVDGVMKNVSYNTPSETFTVHLGTPRPVWDTLRIQIGYHRIPGYPRPNSRQGFYFFKDSIGIPSNLGYTFSEPSDARFWLPCYDEPWEKATLSMSLTVPTGYVPASNGRLASVINNGNGTETWNWIEDHPIATYLMCITASCFAIASLPYVTTSGDTIPLQYYVWPADSSAVSAYLPQLRDHISFYAQTFGEYPFDKYGMTGIVPFGFLGMEHQTITTMNRFYQTNTRVVTHELAHQWWGDHVTCGTWPDIWLNESFATYSEAIWREHIGGFPALKSYMKDTLEHFFFGSWLGAIYNPVGQGFNLFDDVVYSKGAWVLHTLRGVVGDVTFFDILSAYRQKWGGRSAVTSELQSVVDSVTGTDMSWFFDQWIYGQGWPKYASTFSWANDTLDLMIYQQQSLSWPTYKMPMVVRAYHGTSSTPFLLWDSLRTQVFRLRLTTNPDSIVLDPEAMILKQIVDPPSSVDEGGSLPTDFRLFQNYPNPFNPSTTISFQLATSNRVSLKIYDVLGRAVATLAEGRMSAGAHTVEFDASALPSGVYYCRMRTPGGVQAIRMMYLK